MAENTRPSDPSPTKIDLVKATRATCRRARTPMASDTFYNTADATAARTQLISPPPEETLHLRRVSRSTPLTPNILTSNSKRKRNVPQPFPEAPLETTPNPKPRKQLRNHGKSLSISSSIGDSPTRPGNPSPTKSRSSINVPKSPHAEKPQADYLPPIPSSASRRTTNSARARRTTPIPPYEPPTDVFTPPRVVIVTPTVSKSSKRKTANGTKRAKEKSLGIVVVKKEMPPIDLNLPMPPASPTDDPLLLSGPPEPSPTPTRPRVARPREAHWRESLPPSSPISEDDEIDLAERFDWTKHTEPEGSTDLSSMMDVDSDVLPMPAFNFDPPASADDDWTESEDEGYVLGVRSEVIDEGEGEYTGRWRALSVRTKMDPPSSATRARMEEWGRPITPFPKKIKRLELVREEGSPEVVPEEQSQDEDGPNDKERQSPEGEVYAVEDEDEKEERQVREMSVHLEDEEDVSPEPVATTTMEREPAGPFNFDASFEDESVVLEQDSPRHDTPDPSDMVHGSVDHHAVSANLADEGQEEEDEEEREVREMSVEQEEESPAIQHSRSPTPNVAPMAEKRFSPPPIRNVTPGPFFADGTQASSAGVSTPAPHVQDTEVRVEGQQRETTPQRKEGFLPWDEPALVQAMVDEDASDDGDDDGSEDLDIGVVKITSADPRAAARAAAILKQHDYECFTKIMMKQRKRHSFSGSGFASRRGKSVGVLEGGVVKMGVKAKEERRRTMGVVGNRVYIPGSPAMTLPELLKEAEAEVRNDVGPLRVGGDESNPFVTPGPTRLAPGPPSLAMVAWAGDERAWTREEWKLLDACFTDERLEAGGGQVLAPVDFVKAEEVVKRFVELVGGDEVVRQFGEEWNMENLLHRVKALQNKQRSGNVAPPTTPYTPSPSTFSVFGNNRRVPSMEVPDFTPLGRRAKPPARSQVKRPVLPLPVLENAPFGDLPPAEADREPRKKIPMSLLAPRYSHLLEEAIAVSQTTTGAEDGSSASAVVEVDPDKGHEDEEEEAEVANATMIVEADVPSSSSVAAPVPAPMSIGNRVKGFLTSYLPTLSKTGPAGPKKAGQQVPRQPGLPLPPSDLLEKRRGPVETPVRAPHPKPKHPKEIVHLHPAPEKTTMIPRAKKPRRLVELQHVPLPEEKEVVAPRPRRSSGASVKDLVKSFEEKEREVKEVERRGELRRVKSIGEWRGKVTGVGAGTGTRQGKPTWRP